MYALRPNQSASVEDIRVSYLNGNRSPLLVYPTGGGKTIIFSYITNEASKRGKSVLILVHRIELLRQTSEKLTEYNVPHGLINPKYTPKYYETVQVASVQTLVRRLDKIPTPDLIIIDEAHHATAGQWNKILDYFPDAKTLGVTATPIRTDGKGLDSCFDDLVMGPSIMDLIELGYLAQPKVYAPPNDIDFASMRTQMGDFKKDDANEAVDRPTITGDAVAHYRKLCDGAPAVAFCVSVAHAHHVAEQFRGAGYLAESVDGSMSDEERVRILGGLDNGTVQIVCSCDIISEGTDIPKIAAAILLRPTMSEGLYLQQVGRALRVCDGKDYAVILDHVGNTKRHGMPTQDREWSLKGRKKKKRSEREEVNIGIAQCDNCFAVFSPAPVCPECGEIIKETARKAPEEVGGELVEVSAIVKKAARMEVGRARTKEDLVRIASERGYKKGWVYQMMKLKNI